MTPIESRYQDIYAIGCIACLKHNRFRQCQVHHLNLGGYAGQKRRGDEFSVGLCPWHHDGDPGSLTNKDALGLFGPSLKRQKRSFHLAYGTDDELLAKQNQLIAELRERRVA